MGESPQDLKREIEDIRGNLGTTLDQIGDRVSPTQVARRRARRVSARVRGVRNAVMGSAQDTVHASTSAASEVVGSAHETIGQVTDQVRQAPELVKHQAQGNPLAAGLVAFGAGLIVASLLPATEPEQQVASRLQDAAEPLKEKALEAGQQLKADVQGAAQQVADTARGAAQEVKDQAQQSASEIADRSRDAAATVPRPNT